MVDLHGWVPLGAPDPTEINWLHFYLVGPEVSNPGPQQTLTNLSLAGTSFLQVLNPGRFAGHAPGDNFPTDLYQPPYCMLIGGTSEEVRLRSICTAGIPAGFNIELDKPLQASYAIGAILRLKAGWTFSFSQVHFERSLRYEENAAVITPPYRYRVVVQKEMGSLNEAQSKASGTLQMESPAKRGVRVRIDGDPDLMIGYNARIFCEFPPFQNVIMVADDLEYSLGPDCDLVMMVLFGMPNIKIKDLSDLDIVDAHEKKLQNLGQGKTPMPLK